MSTPAGSSELKLVVSSQVLVHVVLQTDRKTDRQKDKRTDRMIVVTLQSIMLLLFRALCVLRIKRSSTDVIVDTLLHANPFF